MLRLGLAVWVAAISALAPVSAQPVCLPIDEVQPQGARLLSPAQLALVLAPFEGRCLGLAEFDQVLAAITEAYVDRGYILARAYLPEQDLTTRALRVEVVEGEISEIRINGRQNPGLEAAAFPGQRGRAAQIRAVEQGLDQLQSMPRWQAQMEFAAGEEVGQSILDVTARTERPLQFRLSSNNRGTRQSGAWITTAALDWTNMLGRADSWSLSYTRNLSPGPLSFDYTGDSSRSLAFSFKIPAGRWRYSAEVSRSQNWLTIPAAFAPIPTRGESWSGALSAQVLLHRDQTSKTHASLKLSHSASENFIQGVRIDASSRALTSLRFALDHERPLWGGTLRLGAHLERGLTWFGAERASAQPAGAPNAQYRLAGFSADWQRKFEGPALRSDLSFTLSGQYSEDKLYGGQQFSLGGASTVRGSKIALASGSSGLLLRSEAVLRPTILDDTWLANTGIYGALDMGRIFAQPGIGAKEAYAVGGTLGIKLTIGKFDADISYQGILASSARLSVPKPSLFVSVGMTF